MLAARVGNIAWIAAITLANNDGVEPTGGRLL